MARTSRHADRMARVRAHRRADAATSFRATASWPSRAASSCRPRRTTIRSARCCSTSRCAREAMPDAPLPAADHYSGGRSRSTWHLDSAQHSHRRRFDADAAGRVAGRRRAVHAVSQAAGGAPGRAGPRAAKRVLTNTLRKAGLPADDRDDVPVPALPRRARRPSRCTASSATTGCPT